MKSVKERKDDFKEISKCILRACVRNFDLRVQSVLLKRALGLKISGYILYKKSQNQRVRAPPAPVLTHSLTPQTLSLLMSVNKRLRDPMFTMFRFSISVYIFIFVKDSRWPVVKTYHFLSCSSHFGK